MAARCQAVLFDLGGVVLRLKPHACFEHWAACANVPAARLRSRFRIDHAYKAHETGAIGFAEYAERLGQRLGIRLAEDDWLSGWNALFAGTFEGVVERLPTLAAALPTYAFTNTNAEHQAAWQARFGDDLAAFERIYASWRIGRRKPDRDAFLWVARALGVAPADILFLDDSAENVAGAQAAGLSAVHVTGAAVTSRVMAQVLERVGGAAGAAGQPAAGALAAP